MKETKCIKSGGALSLEPLFQLLMKFIFTLLTSKYVVRETFRLSG
ncbi:MAG: hypothetical protein ACJAUY_000861 [Cognaticolwellia sp.]|jgi:hypothetical protein